MRPLIILLSALSMLTLIGCGKQESPSFADNEKSALSISDGQQSANQPLDKMSFRLLQTTFDSNHKALIDALNQVETNDLEIRKLKPKLKENTQFLSSDARNNAIQAATQILEYQAQVVALLKIAKWRLSELGNIIRELIVRKNNNQLTEDELKGLSLPDDEELKQVSLLVEERLAKSEQGYAALQEAFGNMQSADLKLRLAPRIGDLSDPFGVQRSIDNLISCGAKPVGASGCAGAFEAWQQTQRNLMESVAKTLAGQSKP